jgi:hypothetical protein
MEKYYIWQKKLSDQLLISAILALFSFTIWFMNLNWH